LIADILVPELETRIAILSKKADLDGIDLPGDVATYLATHIKSNVRELEGALIRLAAFSSLQSRAITVEFAEQILTSLIRSNRGQITIDRIQREVANYFNIKQKDLKSQRRPRAISHPRQIAMYLSRKLTSSSLSEIGQQFGGKDHTTVLNAERKVHQLLQDDEQIQETIEALERIFGR
jgi:chromosomal replication initiator protein